MLAHSCFFSLHDNSPAAIQKLIDDCKKYLPGHPGVLHFSVGTLNPELDRPVNDRDFDVALLIFFDSQGLPRRLPGRPRSPGVHPRKQAQLADRPCVRRRCGVEVTGRQPAYSPSKQGLE